MDDWKTNIKYFLSQRSRKTLLLAPIAFAILIVMLISSNQSPPLQNQLNETITSVRYVEVVETGIVPRAIGYGFVKPEKVWNGVMQVSGEVLYRNPDLRVGTILAAGTELMRVDPTDYELAVSRLEANVNATKARLAELDAREVNIQKSLAIEEKALDLKAKDLERKKTLLKRGSISRSAVDQEERAVLAQEQSVQAQRSQLNLLPTQRQALDAELALAQTQLAQARIDLERTTLHLPFDARIAHVDVEETQVVATGQVTVIADSIARAEVDAQIPLDKFIEILPADQALGSMNETLFGTGGGTAPALTQAGLSALIRLRSGNFTAEWPAKVIRLTDQVDPQTRTVGVVVAVDQPYNIQNPHARPPLAKNMYVEVELQGPSQSNSLLIPRAALHEGQLYLVGEENRLDIRPAEARLVQDNFAVLSSGVEPGDKVILTDLIPAIPNMQLDPVLDETAAKSTLSQAQGQIVSE